MAEPLAKVLAEADPPLPLQLAKVMAEEHQPLALLLAKAYHQAPPWSQEEQRWHQVMWGPALELVLELRAQALRNKCRNRRKGPSKYESRGNCKEQEREDGRGSGERPEAVSSSVRGHEKRSSAKPCLPRFPQLACRRFGWQKKNVSTSFEYGTPYVVHTKSGGG